MSLSYYPTPSPSPSPSRPARYTLSREVGQLLATPRRTDSVLRRQTSRRVTLTMCTYYAGCLRSPPPLHGLVLVRTTHTNTHLHVSTSEHLNIRTRTRTHRHQPSSYLSLSLSDTHHMLHARLVLPLVLRLLSSRLLDFFTPSRSIVPQPLRSQLFPHFLI